MEILSEQYLIDKKQRAAANVALILCQSIYMFYVTSRAVILPDVLSELHGMSFYGITIVLSSMFMTAASPIAGKLGDMFGRKTIYQIGMCLFAASLLICSVSNNVYIFMAATAFCGIGYGLVSTQTYAMYVDVYTASARPKMLSYASAISSVAALIGPIIGGLCVDYINWRVTFILLVPLILICMLCAAKGLPNISQTEQSKEVDYKGIGLFITCVMPFLYTVSTAGTMFEWISVTTAVLLFISLVSLILLIKQEKKFINPIIPINLFKNKTYLVCLSVTILGGIAYAVTNYLPIYYQVVKGMSATMSGVTTTPRQITTVIVSLMLGAYLGKKKNYKVGTIFAVAVTAVSLLLISTFNLTTSILIICIAEIFYGMSAGTIVLGSNAMGQHYLKKEEVGTGLAFMGFINTLGNSAGSAIMGCVIAGYWNIKQIFSQEIYTALSPQQITALTGATTLKDIEAIEQIKNTLPNIMHSQFENQIEVLKNSINTGFVLVTFAIFIISIVVAIILIKFPWNKNKTN